MLKKLYISHTHKDTRTVLELVLKGDGIQWEHSYIEKIAKEQQSYAPTYELFLQNEEGEKKHHTFMPSDFEWYIPYLVTTATTNYPSHRWDPTVQGISYFPEGTPGHEKYDVTSPFVMDGIGTPGKVITGEEADELAKQLVENTAYWIENYELNVLGHVYSLQTGEALVIRGNGTYYWPEL